MFKPGEVAYYRRPEDQRALRCEIISYGEGCYTVRGMRTASSYRRPVLTIPEQHMLPVSVVRRQPKYRREYHGAGLSVPVTESLQRARIGCERLGMDEGAVLFADPLQRLCKRIVGRLARFNGICGADNPERYELQSEFLVAALQAIRTLTSKASDSDLDEFRRFLAGEDHLFGKIVVTIARTGKTSCIRYLQKRQKYHQTHCSIESIRRYSA